jgi:RHS repeat-associated protein
MKKSSLIRNANNSESAIGQTANAVATDERFIYDPYGNRQVLSSSWSRTSDAHKWIYGFQSSSTDVMHFGNRDYNLSGDRWVEPDPAGYVNGVNYYQAFGDNAAEYTDAYGLDYMPTLTSKGVVYGTVTPIIKEFDLGTINAHIEINVKVDRFPLTQNNIRAWNGATMDMFKDKAGLLPGGVNAIDTGRNLALRGPNLLYFLSDGAVVAYGVNADDFAAFVAQDFRHTADGDEDLTEAEPLITHQWNSQGDPNKADNSLRVDSADSAPLTIYLANRSNPNFCESGTIKACVYYFGGYVGGAADHYLSQFFVEWNYDPNSPSFAATVMSGTTQSKELGSELTTWDQFGAENPQFVDHPSETLPTGD